MNSNPIAINVDYIHTQNLGQNLKFGNYSASIRIKACRMMPKIAL